MDRPHESIFSAGIAVCCTPVGTRVGEMGKMSAVICTQVAGAGRGTRLCHLPDDSHKINADCRAGCTIQRCGARSHAAGYGLDDFVFKMGSRMEEARCMPQYDGGSIAIATRWGTPKHKKSELRPHRTVSVQTHHAPHREWRCPSKHRMAPLISMWLLSLCPVSRPGKVPLREQSNAKTTRR